MWSLNKMHQVGELTAAIAVVISLVFVGLQVRDNTIASEAATLQNSVGYDIELLTDLSANPDLARAFTAYLSGDVEELDETELIQARWHFVAILRHLENLYFQYEAGMLSDEVWATREPLILNNIRSPGFGMFLRSENARGFSGQFIEYAIQVRADRETEADD